MRLSENELKKEMLPAGGGLFPEVGQEIHLYAAIGKTTDGLERKTEGLAKG